MKITLQAKSSGDTPYAVDFQVDDGKFTVHCNCQAGAFGKLCKHKTELIAGETSRLFDLSQSTELDRVQVWLAQALELKETAGAIKAAEKVVQREQAKLKSLKKQFAVQLQSGINISGAS